VGNPFVHTELTTQDMAKAKSFYSSLLDRNLEDSDMANMASTMIEVGQGTGCAMTKHAMQRGALCLGSTIPIVEQKASNAKAESLGASVIRHPDAIPNGGALSVI
jgi:uncharacterized protein